MKTFAPSWNSLYSDEGKYDSEHEVDETMEKMRSLQLKHKLSKSARVLRKQRP